MTTPVIASTDPFSFTRATAVFLGMLAAFELAAILVFPLIAVFFAVLAGPLLAAVWIKAGMRTRKWLWWNPAAVPLTQAEGACAVSAALLLAVGILLTGYEAVRFASATGDRDFLTGYAFRYMTRREGPSRPLGMRGSSYSDPATQQRFKDELTKGGIPFVLMVDDGKEFVHWRSEHDAAVEGIKRKRIDRTFSDGRNAAFPDPALQQEFTDWLTQRGVPYEIVGSGGRDYVVWDTGPTDLVRQFMEGRSVDCPGAGPRASAKAGDPRC